MKPAKTYESVMARLNAYLRARKKRLTVERMWIIEQLCQLPQPFTSDQLLQACSERGVARATVFNTIDVLLDAYILHGDERRAGQPATEYEIVAGGGSKLQLVCCTCGKVKDFHDRSIEKMIKERKFLNFSKLRYSLFIYGECKVCSNKKK